MIWGYGDLEHPQAQYFLAKTMCAFALMYITYITQKSKSHWKMFYSQKGESLTIAIEKYICAFFYDS